MGLMERDLEKVAMIKHLGSMTPIQAAYIFYAESDIKEIRAKRRFNDLMKMTDFTKIVKRDYDSVTHVLQYCTKKQSEHSLKLLDLHAQIIYSGWRVIEFENKAFTFETPGNNMEKPCRKIDGKFIIEKDGVVLIVYAEIDDSHKTDARKISDVCNQLHLNFIKRVKNKEPNDFIECFIIATSTKNRKLVSEPIDEQLYICEANMYNKLTKPYTIEARRLGWNFYGQEVIPTAILKLVEDKKAIIEKDKKAAAAKIALDEEIHTETLQAKRIRVKALNILNAKIEAQKVADVEAKRIFDVEEKAKEIKRNNEYWEKKKREEEAYKAKRKEEIRLNDIETSKRIDIILEERRLKKVEEERLIALKIKKEKQIRRNRPLSVKLKEVSFKIFRGLFKGLWIVIKFVFKFIWKVLVEFMDAATHK